MTKSKDTILIELNKIIKEHKEALECLESLQVNKTKSGEYHKNINKAGFEIKHKEYKELNFDTYYNKYCLKYYSYYSIYFKDYAELEQKRGAELERIKNLLAKYEKEKEYLLSNYERLNAKIRAFYKTLNEDEIELLKSMSFHTYLDFIA